MINKDEEENNNHTIKIEAVVLNPERNSFENKLRKAYSKEDISQNFEVLNETKIISWENYYLNQYYQNMIFLI